MDFTLAKEQEFLQRTVREFCEREVVPIADQIDQQDKIPEELISKMAKLRLFGIPYAKKYGGAGGSYMELILALEELGRASAAVSLVVDAHHLGAIPIERHGTEEQKSKFLPDLAQGNGIASFAFTEAATGSDPKAITTTARLDRDQYILNGSKRFISNATYDGSIVIFARENDEISAFIVEKNKEGYTTPTVWDKMGFRGTPVADINLENVRTSAANLLGEKGKGYQLLLETIATAKVGLCGALVGVSQAAFEEAIKYAKERTARGKPISSFQSTQWLIADMASQLEAARWLTYRVASMLDQGANIMKDSAMTKLFVSEMATEVTRKAIEVHGAYGYVKEFKVERLYRDAKLGEIVEGVNEVQRVIVAGNLLR